MTADLPVLPDYDALERAPVVHDPFDHIVVPHFVPEADLHRLMATMPKMRSGGSYPPEALDLSPALDSLVMALQGPTLRDAIARKFSLDLHEAPTMLTVRGRTRAKDGRIHCDSKAKRVTALLYLNPETDAWDAQDGCLRLLRGPHDIEDFAAEIRPARGTLVVFPNGPTTWHGHRQYIGQRYAIQLNYMEAGAAAQRELRRHRLSSLVKRLPLAG
ncbi:2OG-Fe(II) oxygenase family protein [Tanticharoenia sakaeratensis]|jgi:SM-20-related protein|uniref:Prolyl 4-hydroxylase alpha subunit domain-containing protein n=1 Tax=Tanticharoenia sakaeratensis NBRC 103193 TaxID=1231623 RepID=A0A0D6MNK6_9PROT|nr:2OG-Fe(II) oxygenase [Tanticharoenia sakaeratensis]GAN55000.1 hypothetical protein Tasa_036_018 [Tanticharoenia sakaeratensis NBRC 103193]GBQ20415.1 hypothetical protein AA103193_1372 [Tanticharoenia sakaeratensis NBRC 103193]